MVKCVDREYFRFSPQSTTKERARVLHWQGGLVLQRFPVCSFSGRESRGDDQVMSAFAFLGEFADITKKFPVRVSGVTRVWIGSMTNVTMSAFLKSGHGTN